MTRLPFRALLVALLVPVAAVLIGLALLLAWLPQLPAEITVHWTMTGDGDRTGPAWSMPVLLAVVGLALPVIFTLLLARSVTPAGLTATQKVLAVASLFASTFLAFAITSSVAIQLDSTGGARPIGGLLIGGALGGLVLAAGAWFLLPRAVPGRTGAPDAAPPVAVAPGERVVWVGYARFGTGVLVALIATVVLAAAAVAFAVAVSGAWPLLLVPVALVLALLATTSFRVQVDPSGLTVRGTLGWPAVRVPIADVASAGTSTLVPLGEFGGYGMRWGAGGRVGVVTRGGEALEVVRRDGRAVVVTVDDAATAAGLLTAYAGS